MTTKHATCTHPQTKAGRAACRRAGNTLTEATTTPSTRRAVRTDIHRPEVFDPEAYDFGFMGTYRVDAEYMYIRREAAEAGIRLSAEGYRWASHHASGKCDHCGSALLDYAVMLHIASHEMIVVGETCLDGRFEMATAEFKSWRKMRVGAAAKKAKAEKLENFLTANPAMRDLLNYEGDNDFLSSLSDKLREYAELTDRQIEAAEKALTRDKQRAEEKAQAAARVAHLEPLTAGKRTITGTLVHTKWQDSPFGYGASGSLKGLIETAEGYKFWGTIPTAFQGDKGDAITLTATIEPKDGEPTFAFFKRPRLA